MYELAIATSDMCFSVFVDDFSMIVARPLWLGLLMKQRTNGRTWTKQDGKDASRLLAELAKRAEKASGGLKRPEQIQPEEQVPASSGNRGEPERIRGEALHGSPQLPEGQPGEKVADTGRGAASASARSEGGVAGRRLVVANDNICAGRVGSEEWVSARMHRPASSADLYSEKFTGLESFSETSTARWGKK
jgi:hypothetical protein